MTRPGGFCAVVIGTVLDKGRHIPLPAHLIARMEKIGWLFHQDIVWSKVTGGVKRAGSTIRNPYPGYYYPNIMTEYILVFRKAGEAPIYRGKSREAKVRDAFAIDCVFTKDIANTVWHIAPVPPGQLDHPCPFPEEIPYRLVRLYSYTGDMVLDGGQTSTNVVTVTGKDDEGTEDTDTDDHTITGTDVLPTVEITKTADDDSKPEPGGTFYYTVTITNRAGSGARFASESTRRASASTSRLSGRAG